MLDVQDIWLTVTSVVYQTVLGSIHLQMKFWILVVNQLLLPML
jgi:hypothetical protein